MTATEITDDDIATLRKWAAENGDHVRAAVELLIEHDHWLWNDDFAERCVRRGGGVVYLDFAEMARISPAEVGCSEGQAAMLLAIADIGSGRWKVATLDGRNRERVARAVALSVGIGWPR